MWCWACIAWGGRFEDDFAVTGRFVRGNIRPFLHNIIALTVPYIVLWEDELKFICCWEGERVGPQMNKSEQEEGVGPQVWYMTGVG